MKKILVIGALGQIGSELTFALKNRYGNEQVITCDLKDPSEVSPEFFPYEPCNILDKERLESIILQYEIDEVYHLAAILSAVGEKNPQLCWEVNINGLFNVLELSRAHQIKKLICPSSIAVFGPETPKENTPQETIILPKTMYGLTKASSELLFDYYVRKYKMDIRGVRYPGLISYKTLPGGGTTDYAVEIFYEAIKQGKYTCFLNAQTRLPMMYMPDAVRGTIELAEAPFEHLKHYANFNFASMSFTCEQLAQEIKKHIPHFEIQYAPDHRQKIADTWPSSIDDTAARQEWKWAPQYELSSMVEDMLFHLRKKLSS